MNAPTAISNSRSHSITVGLCSPWTTAKIGCCMCTPDHFPGSIATSVMTPPAPGT